VVASNALIDPFAMFRLADIPGLNTRKPAIYHRVRLYKAYEVRRIRPEAIVLGTSRSHLGIRPSHPGWSKSVASRYNLAFDGATTKEMYLYLRHASSAGPLKLVLLGLDSYQLSDAPAITRPDFDPGILLDAPGAEAKLRIALADLRLLVSFDTLRASLETLTDQSSPEPEWFAPDGQRLGEVFFRRTGEMFQEKGPRAYFDAKDKEEIKDKLEGRVPRRSQAPPVAVEAMGPTSFDYIRQIVDFCRENAIDLRIFLTPTHARNLEISRVTGEWLAIEDGKRRLARLVSESATGDPQRSPLIAFDFVDYSSVTTEPLPPPGSRIEMNYYWESSHFKEKVGDLVLDRLLGYTKPGKPNPADFGVPLDARTIEQQLAAIRSRQAEYRRTHPKDVAQITAMLSEVIGVLGPGVTSKSIGLSKD
jgi:hypothetical protein